LSITELFLSFYLLVINRQLNFGFLAFCLKFEEFEAFEVFFFASFLSFGLDDVANLRFLICFAYEMEYFR
jgi:hypothetical protein